MPKDSSRKAYSQQDQRALREAKALARLATSSVYRNYLKPQMLRLAQQGYPNKPEGYKTSLPFSNEYWHAVGGTGKIKELISYIEQQEAVVRAIEKKYEDSPI